MAGKQRSIDAPAPPWRLMPGRDNTDEVSQEPPPAAPEAPPAPARGATPAGAASVDKAVLARQLAERARANAAQKAAEAEATRKATPDKAELARQLVERAKAAKGDTPAAAPARAAKTATPKPAPTAAPRKLSAQEALAAAIAAESAPAPAPAPAPRPAPTPAAAAPAARATPAPVDPAVRGRKLSAQEALAAAIAAEDAASRAPAAPAKATAPAGDPAQALADAFPGAQVDGVAAVAKLPVLVALWKAHRARAQRNGDVALVVTANQVLAAADRGPITVARVTAGGVTWGAFVDAAGQVVGVAQPADTYLQGL